MTSKVNDSKNAMSNDNKNLKEEDLLQLLQDALRHDEGMRQEWQIGEKFRFIRDRLNALFQRVQENLATLPKAETKSQPTLAEDEVYVYVYLYNAQGALLPTWQKMLNADVLYELSVNRPIYTKKSAIESFIRSRPNKLQHAFLTIAVKKGDIFTTDTKDMLDNPLSKVREGALHFTKLAFFTHNGNEYRIDEEGKIKKNE